MIPTNHHRSFCTLVALIGISASLTGCGWHLDAGPSVHLRDSVSVIAAKTVGIERELERQLGVTPGSGAQSRDSGDQPGLHLFVANEVMHRRISALNRRGLAGEHELTLTVEVEARELTQAGIDSELGGKTFSAVRRYVVDQRTVLAAESEQVSLATEMRRELASRILDWLSMIATNTPTNPSRQGSD